MKNHSFITQFIIFSAVLLIFILPPCFTPFFQQVNFSEGNEIANRTFGQWNFPFIQFLYAIVAFILFFYFKPTTNKNRKLPFLQFPILLTVGLLFTSSLLMSFFSTLFNVNANFSAIVKPQTFIQWGFCIITFLFAAFFEEVIYRFYFVDSLLALFECKISLSRTRLHLAIVILCEILGTLVFAFAHYYLGFFSVINAVFGHIILRICYKKNKILLPSIVSHFIYNVISLILL